MSAPKVKVTVMVLLAFIAGLGAMRMAMEINRDNRASEPAPGKQMASAASTDKAYTAKVWLPDLGGLGATVSQPHQVWIQNKANESRLMLEADKTDAVKIKWLAERLLEVCYSDAQISTFRNRFVDVDRTGSTTQVKIVEVTLRRVARFDECKP